MGRIAINATRMEDIKPRGDKKSNIPPLRKKSDIKPIKTEARADKRKDGWF